jgi:hypothetical protein
MATQVNLFPDQGAKYEHVFLYRTKTAVIPLTNAEVYCQIRPYPQSADILFDADNQGKGNIDVTDGPAGEVTLTIPGATTAAWRHDEAHYDIKVVRDGETEPERIAEGFIYLSKSTTR